MGLIVPIWKRKGDVHDPGKYKGIPLLSLVKLLERVLDAMIRRRVECDFGEEQQGSRKGRGTAERPETDGREETGVTGQYGSGFINLEKPFDTVPRKMAMATLRWMGVGLREAGPCGEWKTEATRDNGLRSGTVCLREVRRRVTKLS